MPRRRKILADHGRIDYGPSKSFNFDDEAWAALTGHVPFAHDPVALRREIEHVCAFVIGFAKVNKIGDAAASAASTAAENAKRAALQRLVAALHEAQAAWQEMRAAGFRSSAIMGADKIGQLAASAQELLHRLADAARPPIEPWPILVRGVDAVFRRAGSQPAAHKRVYEPGAAPTWFQEFVGDLNTYLPDGVSRPAASPEALYSAVADAVSEPGCSDEEKKLIVAVEALAGLANELAVQQGGEK